jgi:hypothetical protein
VYFEPLIAALAAVAVDDLGRTALAEQLRGVTVRSSGTRRVTFEAGELTLDYDAVANLDDGAERKAEIQAILERNL